MIDNLLAQLRRQLEESERLPETTRQEMLRHVAAIENRAGVASNGMADETGSTRVQNEEEEPQGLDKLVSSVQELEASHPELTILVNRVAVALGNMGI